MKPWFSFEITNTPPDCPIAMDHSFCGFMAGLTVRAQKALRRIGNPRFRGEETRTLIKSLEDLCNLYETDLLATKNVGRTTVNEIREHLAAIGLKLKGI